MTFQKPNDFYKFYNFFYFLFEKENFWKKSQAHFVINFPKKNLHTHKNCVLEKKREKNFFSILYAISIFEKNVLYCKIKCKIDDP